MQTSLLISIIDDDSSVRCAIDDLLKSSGYSTRVFGAAEVFLNSSSVWDSDCVVSDIEMPGTSGVELLRSLRVNRIRVPVILMSGLVSESASAEAAALGAFAIIDKPFMPEHFLDVLYSAVWKDFRAARKTGFGG